MLLQLLCRRRIRLLRQQTKHRISRFVPPGSPGRRPGNSCACRQLLLWRQAKPFCHTSPKPASPPAGCRTPNSTTRPTEALLARVATKKRCAARIPLTCYCPELKPAKPAMRPARTMPNRAASNAIRITTGQREKKSRPLSVSPRQEPASDSTATRTLIIRSRAKHVAAWI
jgi:hypothetical protein